MDTLIEYLNKRAKEKRKEEKKLKDKFNSLSLVERDACERITKRRNTPSVGLYFLFGVPKVVIFLLVFAFVLDYFLLVDIIMPIRIIVTNILSLWVFLIIIGLCVDLTSMRNLEKLKRNLLLKKKPLGAKK